jgi:transglutaminase-like putative cysteine protease
MTSPPATHPQPPPPSTADPESISEVRSGGTLEAGPPPERVGGTLPMVWAFALLSVGAVQLAAGWAGMAPAAVFAGAVLVTFGVVRVARRLGVPAGFVAVGVLLATMAGGYLISGSGTVEALSDALPRLLTAPRPAPATAELLAPGVLLVVVVALAVALSVLGNGRVLLAPPAGAAVLYLAAALLTAGRADRRGLVALALVAMIGIGWLLVDRAGRSRGRGRLVPQAALLTLLAALTLLAGVVPVSNPFEPRDLVTPPVDDLSVPSPLPQLSSWAAAGDAELFRVRGPETPLRLVALSDYTGATWRAASLYGPIGAVRPPDLPDGERTAATELDVTITGLAGPWLPTGGRPTATSAPAVVDPDSGSLVLPAGVSPGLRYTVRGLADAADDRDLLTAAVPATERYLALPGLPFSLAEYARRTVASARTPFERAVAIEDVVRTGRRIEAKAPVGSSYARLETFLFGATGTAGAGTGTAEQFASAFAVLARAIGLPSRVVVGFRPVPPGEDGVTVVRAGDATAWPEVYFSRWGWVSFDPTPGSSGVGSDTAAKRAVINRLATPTPTTSVPSTTAPVPLTPSRAPAADAAASPPAGSRLLGLLLLLGAIPLSLALLLGSLRAARRVRLRRAGPTGAWTYVLDTLQLAGRTPAPHQPAPEVARTLAGDSPAAVPLAHLADRAAFAPGPPPPGYTAWPLARQVRTALRRGTPWYRRLHWPIDPRPLWRR